MGADEGPHVRQGVLAEQRHRCRVLLPAHPRCVVQQHAQCADHSALGGGLIGGSRGGVIEAPEIHSKSLRKCSDAHEASSTQTGVGAAACSRGCVASGSSFSGAPGMAGSPPRTSGDWQGIPSSVQPSPPPLTYSTSAALTTAQQFLDQVCVAASAISAACLDACMCIPADEG